jgi:PAT family beta-lactamase induction signal transducer AmpG
MARFTLLDSSRIRYLTGAILYFAQGIPRGLLGIAIPAWLASQGVTAAAIASYLAVVILPWVFKLVTGPFMDRFQYPAMGRRRPWVLGAQLGLSLSLLALMLVEDPANQMGTLMLVGILINIFAATQDVAVDGMAIDLTPVNEQGRLNAFMSFGKAAGWSIAAAVSGVLLVNFGMAVTATAASVSCGVIFLAFVLVTERPGERTLPWSKGQARGTRQAAATIKEVFAGINEVLWKPVSLIVMLIMVLDGLIGGYGDALMPIAAVKVFGFTTPQWSNLVAVMGIIGAAVTLVLGPIIDRIGPKRMLILTASLVGIHAFLLAQTQFLWTDSLYVKVMLSIWVMMLPITMVSVLALAMAVCSSACAATQFAIYMSVANLGHSAGSKLFGMVSEQTTWPESYLLLSILVVGMIAVLFFHRHQHREAAADGGRGPRIFPITSGGGEGGVFFSGAMRCPKCRSDMLQLDVDGIVVDRCDRCQGIWFDKGEMEALRDKELAEAIDTGSAKRGPIFNNIDEYRCPRCGGVMTRVVDEQQRHIAYETCTDCGGSYFDAGEFRDISQLTLSDVFKRRADVRPGSRA